MKKPRNAKARHFPMEHIACVLNEVIQKSGGDNARIRVEETLRAFEDAETGLAKLAETGRATAVASPGKRRTRRSSGTP